MCNVQIMLTKLIPAAQWTGRTSLILMVDSALLYDYDCTCENMGQCQVCKRTEQNLKEIVIANHTPECYQIL